MHCNSHLSNAYFSTVIEPQQWLYQCSILAANLLWDRKWTAYLYPSLTSRPCLDGFFIFCPIIKNNKVSCEYGTLMSIIAVVQYYYFILQKKEFYAGWNKCSSKICLTIFVIQNPTNIPYPFFLFHATIGTSLEHCNIKYKQYVLI